MFQWEHTKRDKDYFRDYQVNVSNTCPFIEGGVGGMRMRGDQFFKEEMQNMQGSWDFFI